MQVAQGSHKGSDLHWREWHSNRSSLGLWFMSGHHNDLPSELGEAPPFPGLESAAGWIIPGVLSL